MPAPVRTPGRAPAAGPLRSSPRPADTAQDRETGLDTQGFFGLCLSRRAKEFRHPSEIELNELQQGFVVRQASARATKRPSSLEAAKAPAPVKAAGGDTGN